MTNVSGAERELRGLRTRIEEYRRVRGVRAPLTAGLWSEAASWAERLGVYGAAKALGLSYDSLRRHAELAAEGPAFVEVSGAQVLGASGHVVEMADARGHRLTVRVAAGERLDVAAVVAAFCGVHS